GRAGLIGDLVSVATRQQHEVTASQRYRRRPADREHGGARQEQVEFCDRGTLDAETPRHGEIRQAVHDAADSDLPQQAAEPVLSWELNPVHDTSPALTSPDLTNIMSDQTLSGTGLTASMYPPVAPSARPIRALGGHAMPKFLVTYHGGEAPAPE